jgi:hypothetical protein
LGTANRIFAPFAGIRQFSHDLHKAGLTGERTGSASLISGAPLAETYPRSTQKEKPVQEAPAFNQTNSIGLSNE